MLRAQRENAPKAASVRANPLDDALAFFGAQHGVSRDQLGLPPAGVSTKQQPVGKVHRGGIACR